MRRAQFLDQIGYWSIRIAVLGLLAIVTTVVWTAYLWFGLWLLPDGWLWRDAVLAMATFGAGIWFGAGAHTKLEATTHDR